MMHLRFRNQRGDTLVEVLIAMAIISLVLVGAYVATNRNSAALQKSQERQQAQRLVEAQIEMLRAHRGIVTSGNCYNASSVEATGTACNQSSSTNSGATYAMKVTVPTAGIDPTCLTSAACTYTVSAVWTSLDSKSANDSNVTLYYRIK